MERFLLPLVVLTLLSGSTARPAAELGAAQTVNERPIIGIITMEVSDDVMRPYGRTYIPSSYVKYVEAAGARAAPIRLNRTQQEYEKIFMQINGLLFIGGAVDLEKSDYAITARIFYKLALEANSRGDYFPVWGTCMGLQILTVLVAGENLLSKTTRENISLPLNLTADASSSRMFQSFPPHLFTALSREPLTGNFHHYGITEEVFRGNSRLNDFFSILSTNVADDGSVFVSTMEGRQSPFYGVQWHPEVSRFQWSSAHNYPHTHHAVQLSTLLADFFINEGRRSAHVFSSPEEEAQSLIYTHTPTYTANFTGYQQVYFF
ncbi:gamma-glutamyl hydrolase [Engraulis encrasicolus]|uniref:gamma-glutamyl hydrolase n=1 Tax=Engraulis encrasicolus TaxID=184585 RepID=UPI002FD3E588